MNKLQFELLKEDSITNDVIIGFFDIIHNGHKKLLENVDASIITFFSIPRKTAINSLDVRIKNLINLGFKKIYVVEEQELKLTAKEFIDKYFSNANNVIVGSDFKFGSDFKSILEFTNILKLKLINYDDVFSTTKIKQALQNGDCKAIRTITNKNFVVTHIVNHGNQMGRVLGFPTINFNFVDHFILSEGTYYSKTLINGKEYKSVSVMIKNKKIQNKELEVLETHILDFNDDLYNQIITVEIIEKINNIRKFDNLDDLKEFIKLNVTYVKKIEV